MAAKPPEPTRSLPGQPPAEDNASIIKTTATLAWATSAFAFSVGALRWVTPEGAPIDAALGLVLGGGAAYLALALERGPRAVAECQRIAFVAGIANGVMLPLAIAACFGGSLTRLPDAWGGALGAPGTVAVGIATVLVGAAVPWIAYGTLRAKRVNEWFSTTRPVAPAGMWLREP